MIDQKVLRTDIVMDLGESLNPAIDIGQIEGGFMQGYGLFVMEQLIHSPEGALLTKGLWCQLKNSILTAQPKVLVPTRSQASMMFHQNSTFV